MLFRIQNLYLLLIFLGSAWGAFQLYSDSSAYVFMAVGVVSSLAVLFFKHLNRQKPVVLFLLGLLFAGGGYLIFLLQGGLDLDYILILGAQLILAFLTFRAIGNDQKIVRSANRLR